MLPDMTDISYEALLDDLKWKSLSRVVMERRLLCVKKYLDGTRFTVDGVFSLQPSPASRFSQRILSQKQRHQYQLALSNSQRNTLERRLAIEKMKELWNALPEMVVCLLFRASKVRFCLKAYSISCVPLESCHQSFSVNC